MTAYSPFRFARLALALFAGCAATAAEARDDLIFGEFFTARGACPAGSEPVDGRPARFDPEMRDGEIFGETSTFMDALSAMYGESWAQNDAGYCVVLRPELPDAFEERDTSGFEPGDIVYAETCGVHDITLRDRSAVRLITTRQPPGIDLGDAPGQETVTNDRLVARIVSSTVPETHPYGGGRAEQMAERGMFASFVIFPGSPAVYSRELDVMLERCIVGFRR